MPRRGSSKPPAEPVVKPYGCDLFGNPRYLLQLYQALHPEDKKVREEDLKTVTLENIFTDSIYNDLGFIKGNKLMVLVEA